MNYNYQYYELQGPGKGEGRSWILFISVSVSCSLNLSSSFCISDSFYTLQFWNKMPLFWHYCRSEAIIRMSINLAALSLSPVQGPHNLQTETNCSKAPRLARYKNRTYLLYKPPLYLARVITRLLRHFTTSSVQLTCDQSSEEGG